MVKKIMDHNEYPKRLKSKSLLEILFIINDAGEAERANPHGENSGYYADEQHYAQAELRRRNEKYAALQKRRPNCE